MITKALERDRRERYPTARALGEALTKAVAPIGGPLAGSAISEEIERAFAPRLRSQRSLIKTLRAVAKAAQLRSQEIDPPDPASAINGSELLR